MKNTEIIRCSSCGSSEIAFINNNIGKCQHCQSTMLLPKQNSEIVALLNSAYLYRENFNYDLAIKSYQFVLEKDSAELSAYEGIILSEYGIEYVKDKYTNKMIPTCHRAHFTSIYDNEYYKTLISLANDEQRNIIETKAKEIDKLQKAIERQLKNEQEYDIFISYKATNQNGEKTEDSIIAHEIYEELTKKNYKVFFAEKSLEDRIGSEYEPIIFKALHTSKIFILVGTSKENVESNWVRNEWSRFIDRIKNENNLTKQSFVPVFKDMNPYDMPKVNNAYVQGVDAGKIGYMVTLVDGVTKMLKPEKEQKVLETFENLDNFATFSKLQKQKTKELKQRNWNEFKQSKGIKKWLYYLLLASPVALSIIHLVFCCLTNAHLRTQPEFIVFIIVAVALLTVSIITVSIQSKKFIINIWSNIIIPFTSLGMGLILAFSLYSFYPIALGGFTAKDFAGYYRSDGYYYYKSDNNELHQSYLSGLDTNRKFEKDIKIENGKRVFYLPESIDDIPMYNFNAALPEIDIIVIPKINDNFNYNLYIFQKEIADKLEYIYCYDINKTNIHIGAACGYDTFEELPFKVCTKVPSALTGSYPHYIEKDGGYYD